MTSVEQRAQWRQRAEWLAELGLAAGEPAPVEVIEEVANAAQTLPKATAALEPLVREVGAKEMRAQDGIAKLSIVGIGMRSHSGVAARLFEALSDGGINIQMISTSEIKTSVILDEARIAEAANLAHAAFGLGDARP